jgi:hypothetical protein
MALHQDRLPTAANVVTLHATRVQVQIVPIARHVRTVTDQNVVMSDVHQVIVQQVVHTETATRVHLQIAVTIDVQVPIEPIVRHVLMVIDQNAVMIVVQVPIDQQVVRTVIAIPVQAPVHLPIAVTAQQVVHTEIEIRVHLPIVQRAVHTVTVTRVQVPIVRVVARRVDRQIDAMIVILDRATHVPQQTNPAVVTHMVAIVHALAMTATRARLRVTANVADVQIVPEVVFPMIAKNVHVAG